MSAKLATAIVGACANAGVREFCVCAGARNVSIIVALERSTGCRCWHFYDERSAAFFALGRMMLTGSPVAVVTTSGTAVAELLPATIEGFYQSLPLVLLTADRPTRYRGSGAPQAIEQSGIFSGYARFLDVEGELGEAESFLDRAVRAGRPAHVNVCLEEPDRAEIDATEGVEFLHAGKVELEQQDPGLLEVFLEEPAGLLVMLGNLRDDERAGLLEFLQALGAPVLAEAGSGLREKLPGLAVREVPDDVRKVLRIGGVPSHRFWRDLESKPDVRVLSVSRGRFSGLARSSEVIGSVDWQAIDPPAVGYSRPIAELEVEGELRWFRILSQNIPSGSKVLIGNSLPIREWNLAATFEDRGLQCFSCRGANGIDGQLSASLGLASDQEETWAIVGDLTALYDLGAPWILKQLDASKVHIVVINNGGGMIFAKLPGLANLSDGERGAIENNHGVRLKGWADMWGLGYQQVDASDDGSSIDWKRDGVIEIIGL